MSEVETIKVSLLVYSWSEPLWGVFKGWIGNDQNKYCTEILLIENLNIIVANGGIKCELCGFHFQFEFQPSIYQTSISFTLPYMLVSQEDMQLPTTSLATPR